MFDLQGAEDVVHARATTRTRALSARTEVQGALVSIDSHNGHILAMVGGRKFERADQFNRAILRAGMEPGSPFKPLYYSAAIASRKFTPATMILDAPVVFMTAGRHDLGAAELQGGMEGTGAPALPRSPTR